MVVLAYKLINFTSKAKKKKGIRFSGHFLQKQMRQAGFFFYFLFAPKTNEAPFFFFTQSNLTLM